MSFRGHPFFASLFLPLDYFSSFCFYLSNLSTINNLSPLLTFYPLHNLFFVSPFPTFPQSLFFLLFSFSFSLSFSPLVPSFTLFPDFVTFLRHVCKGLIIKGSSCCLGRRAIRWVKQHARPPYTINSSFLCIIAEKKWIIYISWGTQ